MSPPRIGTSSGAMNLREQLAHSPSVGRDSTSSISRTLEVSSLLPLDDDENCSKGPNWMVGK